MFMRVSPTGATKLSDSHAKEIRFMLKKTNYEEPRPSGPHPNKDSSPTIIKSSVIDADESRAAIATKNEDIPRVRPKKASIFGSSLVFRGQLSADEEIIIEGIVEGTIGPPHEERHSRQTWPRLRSDPRQFHHDSGSSRR